jgi:5-methylcytosine-specific restriction endonuclease McrA
MPKKKKSSKDYRKQHIPKALREQCWIHNFGKKYEHKCYIKWCSNKITVFDFHVGHNIPESKGGKLCLENVKPICSRCNHSMGSRYTITEWMKLDENIKQPTCCFLNKFCSWCGDIKKNHKKNCPNKLKNKKKYKK